MKKKIGIFGGSFNPPHQGHLAALAQAQKILGLTEVLLVPTSQNPLKAPTEGATPQQRFEMTQIAAELLGPQFSVVPYEIQQKGPSYTIDLIEALHEKYDSHELYFLLGLDHLETFEQWKSAKKLLESANWVFLSRPGFPFPKKLSEIPKWFQPMVESFRFNRVKLKKGHSLEFVQIPEVDVSGTQIRKWLRTGKKVGHLVPLPVEQYIREHKIYQNLAQRNLDSRQLVDFATQVLFEKKAVGVRAFDLQKIFYPCEFAIVASGTSTRHAQSLAENVMRAMKDEFGVWPQGSEGMDEGRWVLLDYGSVMVHVFYDFVRREYSIEHLWSQSTEIPLQDPSLKPAT